jgi:hypothetical protein
MTPTISKNGSSVAPMSAHTARAIWREVQTDRQAPNVKTMDQWRAIRHQYRTTSTKALTIATKAARECSMAYILHADDKVTRVMIDWQGNARVSSAYPA